MKTLLTATLLLSIVLVNTQPEATPMPVFSAQGLITPYQTVEVAASVDGIIENIAVERGDLISKGQVLANIESSVEKAAYELAMARTEFTGELRTRRASLAFAETSLKQDEILYKKEIISVQDIEKSRTQKELAAAELLQAEENQRLARLNLEQARATLDLRTLRSTIDGIVVERLLSPGELVTRQSEKKILKLAQISPLLVELILPVEQFGQIKIGDNATVFPEAPVGGQHNARVTVVDRLVDAASGTFGVRLELPNPENGLPAGLKCRVNFLP